MKKVALLFLSFFVLLQAWSQDSLKTTKKTKKDWSKVTVAYRPKDHLLMQIGYNMWTNTPDTIQSKGVPLSYNFYLMFDFPFKTDPRFSVAIGAGAGFDNKGFEKTYIDISGKENNRLTFTDVSDTNHFKKYKIVHSFLEAPLELRFFSNPEQNLRSWKGAVGLKVGTLLGAGTRGKELQNKNGGTVNDYVLKERAKRFFNSTRFAVTGRFGYGIVSVYASYQVNAFMKEGLGPSVRPLQIGLTISGL